MTETNTKLADIYWDADGHYFTDTAKNEAGDGPHVDLDAAIVAAHTAGFKVRHVLATRGHYPSRGTKASREKAAP